MINLFSDSPCVSWTLPVVKHLRTTPESRAGFPEQTAEQSLLQSQSWGRLPMVCPISKVILPFLSRPTHTHTDTRVHVHPKPAAGMGSNMSCFTKLFQSCYARVQPEMHDGKDPSGNQETNKPVGAIPLPPHLMVWTGKKPAERRSRHLTHFKSMSPKKASSSQCFPWVRIKHTHQHSRHNRSRNKSHRHASDCTINVSVC